MGHQAVVGIGGHMKPKQALRTLLGCLILTATPVTFGQFASVRVQVVDVGQGDGILIRTPNQRWIVIDAGTNGQMADAMQDPDIWNVDRIALVVVSHRHKDHYNGMDEVLRGLAVDRFLGLMEDCPNRSQDDLIRQIIGDRSIAVVPLDVGSIEIDGVRLTVLPLSPRKTCPSNENNNSIVVRLDFGEFSMLFSGDAEVSERKWLVDNHGGLLDVDVLKAAHHGSDNGTSQEWLDAVTPERVVISAGVHGGFRHPHGDAVNDYVAATGGKVYCTNRHGTVRVYGFRDGRVRITRQRASNKSCVYDGTHY